MNQLLNPKIFDLLDIWRHLNPIKTSFKWRTKDNKIRSRLARIYIPSDLEPHVSSTFIQFFPWSDHDVCGIKMSLLNAQPQVSGG